MLEECVNDVGAGWKPILAALDSILSGAVQNAQNNATRARKEFQDPECQADAHIQILQVKEKFGGLRVYWQGTGLGERFRLEAEGATMMAEVMSFKVCENCGSMQDIATRGKKGTRFGWIRTQCANCHKKSDGEGS